MFHTTQRISDIEAPPIAEAFSWIKPSPRGRELLNLCQAVPSYPPAEALQAEFARLAQDGATGGYTHVLGIDPLRHQHAVSISAAYKCNVSPEQVGITTGCNQAFAASVMALAQAGDNVVLPSPYYFNHHMWLRMLGIECRTFPAFSERSSEPRIEDAAALIDARTRAIVLCTPNNPTGQIYSPETLTQFFELARSRGIALVLDETYRDFRPDLEPAHRLFDIANWDETLVQLYSFSKIYALAGYRLGSITASPRFLADVEKVLDCMTICPPHITQRGVVFGLQHLDQWKAEKRNLMRTRLDALRRAFQHPKLKYELVSSGAYFAYVRHPFAGEASKPVAKRLVSDHDVLCLPGTMFGADQEAYLRFAFANVDGALMEPLAERLIESQ
jgi:aspartate/methionine/tyrosine aminotransferase